MKYKLTKIWFILLCFFCVASPAKAAEGIENNTVLFKDTNGEAIETFTGEALYAEYTGRFSVDERLVLTVAMYECETLAEVQLKTYAAEELEDGESVLSDTLVPAVLDTSFPGKYKVKAFAFDEDFRPLCNAAAITAENLHVFEYTENAMPGNAIGIHGGGFNAGSTVLLESIETAQGTVTCNQALEVLTVSESYIGTQLPANLDEGIYNIRVKNGTFQSALLRINAPDAWQVMNTAGVDLSPGYTFALYGNNLDFEGAVPKVKFKDTETGQEYMAAAGDNDDTFQLTVTAPQGIVPGKSYDIYVNNGFGTLYEKGPQVNCISGGTDLFGLGVPWSKAFDDIGTNIINVRSEPYLAAGNGMADDSTAIQAAIDAAAAAGGGVVYLPQGTYNTAGEKITLKPKVVLKGDGPDKTVLTTLAVPDENSHMIRLDGDYIGITGINIVSPENTFVHIVHTNRKNHLFIINCKLENKREQDACAVRLDLCSNILIKNNEFYNYGKQNTNRLLSLDTNTDLWLTGNKMEWRTSRIMMTGSERIQCDNNEMWRWTDADFDYFDNVLGRYAHAGYFSISGGSDIMIANNTAGKKGEGLLEHRSDGEFVLYEGSDSDYISIGQATGADLTSISDTSGKNGEKWASANDLSDYMITITAGTGVGQTRGIAGNETTKITVDRAWDIIPDETSCYSVCKKANERIIVRDNTLNEISNGILFYQAVLRKIIITGNTFNDSPNIWLRVAQKEDRGQLNTIRNVLIENNAMYNTKNYYPAQIIVQTPYVNGSRLYGTGFFNITVRGNTVQAYNGPNDNHPGTQWKRAIPDEGYFCHVSPEILLTDNATATQRGVIFDSNTAINCKHAYYINTGAYQTMIINPVTENIGQLVWDDDLSEPEFGGTHASVGTVIKP